MHARKRALEVGGDPARRRRRRARARPGTASGCSRAVRRDRRVDDVERAIRRSVVGDDELRGGPGLLEDAAHLLARRSARRCTCTARPRRSELPVAGPRSDCTDRYDGPNGERVGCGRVGTGRVVVTVSFGSDDVLPAMLASIPDGGRRPLRGRRRRQPPGRRHGARPRRDRGRAVPAPRRQPGLRRRHERRRRALLGPPVEWVLIANPDLVLDARIRRAAGRARRLRPGDRGGRAAGAGVRRQPCTRPRGRSRRSGTASGTPSSSTSGPTTRGPATTSTTAPPSPRSRMPAG